MTDFSTYQNGVATRSPLLTRARLSLEEKEWERANQFCERVLNETPVCAEAYLIKLLAELHLKSEDEFVKCPVPIENRSNYQKALIFSSDEQRRILAGYAEQAAQHAAVVQAAKAALARKRRRKMAKIASVCACVFIVVAVVIAIVAYQNAPAEIDGLRFARQGSGYAVTGTVETRDTYVIPAKCHGKSVVAIGTNAFAYQTSLRSVAIPSSVTNIGEKAFCGCTEMTSVSIPNGVIQIGESAFEGCTGLKAMIIPNSVTSIGFSAFKGCTGMNALAMGNSITDIGGRAFEDCTGIKSIIVPSSVKSIGKNAFAGCTGLTLVTFINTSGWFYSADSTVTLGTAISVGDAKTNADNLRATYSDYYWFRK